MIRHFLSTEELTLPEVESFFAVARSFGEKLKNEKSQTVIPLLAGQAVANLFFENSTRTRLSFEVAARRLGASVLNFAASTSSLNKGETLIDTAKNIEALKPNCLVVRHQSAGSPYLLSRQVSIPVINAGDGFHEHPTQALLDVFTMIDRLKSVKNKRVVIIGDIAHSRVARSNIYLLKKLGASVAVCGPPTLLPPSPEVFGVDFARRIEDVLPDADVVMALRVQLERQNRMQIPSVNEYTRFWGIDLDSTRLMKKDAIIMHPGPVNRGVELDPSVADGPNSVILDQVFNGVIIRMSVLAHLCLHASLGEVAAREKLSSLYLSGTHK